MTSQKAPDDNINWFGVKVGATNEFSSNASSAGVGKYLGNKRPLVLEGDDKALPAEESKKRKRLGFGDFEGW